MSRPAAIPDPSTIIYGTYAGSAEQLSPAKAIDGWEDEGGALDPPQFAALPEGMTSKTVRQYHVGPYVYQDIDLAMAEHLRQLSAD